jgi:hypothetical protein
MQFNSCIVVHAFLISVPDGPVSLPSLCAPRGNSTLYALCRRLGGIRTCIDVVGKGEISRLCRESNRDSSVVQSAACSHNISSTTTTIEIIKIITHLNSVLIYLRANLTVQSPITELARVRRKKEQRNYKQYRNWKV